MSDQSTECGSCVHLPQQGPAPAMRCAQCVRKPEHITPPHLDFTPVDNWSPSHDAWQDQRSLTRSNRASLEATVSQYDRLRPVVNGLADRVVRLEEQAEGRAVWCAAPLPEPSGGWVLTSAPSGPTPEERRALSMEAATDAIETAERVMRLYAEGKPGEVLREVVEGYVRALAIEKRARGGE